MQYGNNANKNDKKKSTNTRGFQFMNSENPICPSTASIGWWDGFMTLSMSPALNKNEQKDDRKFNYEISVNTALTPDKMLTLSKIIDKYIEPAMENNEEICKGIPVAGNSLVAIGTKKIGDNVNPYISIFKGLDETTMKPQISIHYYFNTIQPIISNYNEETGSFSKEETRHGEFELFKNLLGIGSVHLSNVTAHTNRVSNRFYNDIIKENIESLCYKQGITPTGTSSYKKYSSSSGSIFDTKASNSNDTKEDASFDTQEGLDDIPF